MLVLTGLLLVFGVLLPWLKGMDFLDPVMIGAYACLGGLFAAPHAARAAEQGRLQDFSQALKIALRSGGFGEGLVIAMLALGVATVNIGRLGRGVRLPELDTLAETALFGLALTAVFSLGSVWLTMKFSANAARRVARLLFLLLAVAFYYWSSWLPSMALRGAALSLLLVLLLTVLLRKELTAK